MMGQQSIALHEYKSLVLIGHGGRRLWEAMTEADWSVADPIDSYSQRHTEHFMKQHLPNDQSLLLFPSQMLIPLQQIGQFVGWSHPSPLGLGINPEFGVWFAYRAAFLTTAVLPDIQKAQRPSPCESCVEKPCISVCPGRAVFWKRPFDVEACASHRLKLQSSCSDRCLSRMACPVAPEHQYTLKQIQYHYGLSLETFRTYFPHLSNS